jgi:hypothetical protein
MAVTFAYRYLDRLRREIPIDVIIEGDARGADRIAGYWARRSKIDNLKFRADWSAHGNNAGPIRNQRMIDEGKPDLVIAFPGGKGTRDMIAKAEAAGIEVVKAHPLPGDHP